VQNGIRHTRLSALKATVFFFALLLLSIDISASETSKLSVGTSFPEEFSRIIGKAFERSHPDIAIDFSYRATTRLIEHLIESDDAQVDLVWMSSPVGIRELKQNGLLAGDPAECIFAYSRFGVMWREDRLAARGILPPKSWHDLALPQYRGEVGISSPSRSGTMAVFVEAVLQTEGWARGWAKLQELGGSLATITARSIGVREGLLHGRFSAGVGVDFLAKTIDDGSAPVRFLASPGDILLPASACLLQRAEKPERAKRFQDFLRSEEGQALLSHPLIQRISLKEAQRALEDSSEGKVFDVDIAERRRGLVAALFDQLITHRQDDLRRFWAEWHDANNLAAVSGNDAPRTEIADRLERARAIAGAISVPEFMTNDPVFTSIFKLSARVAPPKEARGMRQRLLEDWSLDSRNRLRAAGELVAESRGLIEKLSHSIQPATHQ
jgi:phosphoglycerate transport regulatory protein PgtC